MAVPGKRKLIGDIVGRLVRRHSTAVVLLHHAFADSLGLGPTDLKCFDLLREHRVATGSELAGLTGLTSGAITGVVARLERAGFLRREPDAGDRRQQILRPVLDRMAQLHAVFEPLHQDLAALLGSFDPHQLDAIARFLTASSDFAYRHAALLRARRNFDPDRTRDGVETI